MKLSRFNRYLTIITATVLLAGFGTFAQAQDYKIGVVDPDRLLSQSPTWRKSVVLIENEFSPRNKQMAADVNALKALEDKLGKDGAIMGETERVNLERDIVNKRRELQRADEQNREDFNFRRNEELGKAQTEIVNAIQAVAKANNFDLVLSQGVIFYSPKVDMTDLVIQHLTKTATPN